MFARKIVPILLVAGAVHMMMHHNHFGQEESSTGLPGDGVAHKPQFGHGPFAHRGEWANRAEWAKHGDWANRVPPMFEMWHKRAHAAESGQSAAQNPPSATPAV